jgi:hypothetical protein
MMTTNNLEFYVDLWNNFYRSKLLENVAISDATNVHFGSYTEPFYSISGTIDVVMDVHSSEWSKLITDTERYFTGTPPNRAMEREAVIEELNTRDVQSLSFKVKISTRISRDSYDYVERGGSYELDGFIDTLVIDKYVTVDGEEHSGDELQEGSVFYKEVLLHFIDSLYNPIDSIGNSLRIIVKRKRN